MGMETSQPANKPLSIRELRALKMAGTPIPSQAIPSSSEQRQRIPIQPELLPGAAATFAANVHPEVLAQLNGDASFLKEAQAFADESAEHPHFKNIYERIVINNDRELLRKKTTEQYKDLHTRYMGEAQTPEMAQQAQKRLEAFDGYISSMRSVRSEKRRDIDTLKSPRLLGRASSFGPQDPFVQADAYVYASLDGIRHSMAQNGDTYLDETTVEEAGELVMQDIANMGTAGLGNKDRRYRDYLANMFDYAQGKQLLALYLANVFNDPDEASAFFRTFSSPKYAQLWPTLDEQDATGAFSKERLAQIIQKMRTIAMETRIQPPMSLEVRVRDQIAISR